LSVPSTYFVDEGGGFCATAAPAPITNIARVAMAFEVFIVASADDPVIL
jgi:hypothetical protein